MGTQIVYQLSHDLFGHEQRIPFGVYAIIRDATVSHSDTVVPAQIENSVV
jgi:hypothetical protein